MRKEKRNIEDLEDFNKTRQFNMSKIKDLYNELLGITEKTKKVRKARREAKVQQREEEEEEKRKIEEEMEKLHFPNKGKGMWNPKWLSKWKEFKKSQERRGDSGI